MVKNILLRCDESLFYRMKKDKLQMQERLGREISWETYVKILFGFKKKNECR